MMDGGHAILIRAYQNANYLLSQSKGELICLFHADDVYEPNIISQQADFIQKHTKAEIVLECISEKSR